MKKGTPKPRKKHESIDARIHRPSIIMGIKEVAGRRKSLENHESDVLDPLKFGIWKRTLNYYGS